MTMPSPSRGVARPLGIWPGGPPAAFAGSVLAAFATLAVCWLTLPRDFALPFVATLLFALAAVVAFAGWSQRPAGRQDAVTYLDVAGSGSLIPQSRQERATLLSALLLEKALYELRYEMNMRPGWVRIPIAGVLQLLETGT